MILMKVVQNGWTCILLVFRVQLYCVTFKRELPPFAVHLLETEKITSWGGGLGQCLL